jgi:8-oxo-dGTP diphosphatase
MATIIPAPESVDQRRGIDYTGISCVAICHDGHGRILLHKRSRNARDEQGKWDLIGGALEFGEKVSGAITREVREEICTAARDITFLGFSDILRENNGTPTHWVALYHAVLIDPKTVKIGEPHKMDALEWFTSATLPSPLHPMFPHALQLAQAAGIIS